MNTTTTNEKMGIQISENLEWDGFAILEVTQSALTNSNFHKEAKVIGEMLAKLNADLEAGLR